MSEQRSTVRFDQTGPKTADGRRHRLGIILPCFNHQALLAGALGAIAGQSSPPDEVIVIDDGSSVAGRAAIAAVVARHHMSQSIAGAGRLPCLATAKS